MQNNHNLTGLPETILEEIFANLTYKDLMNVAVVCDRLAVTVKRCFRTGFERIVKDLLSKIEMLQRRLNLGKMSVEECIRFNQTVTALSIMYVTVYSTFVLSVPGLQFALANILDLMTEHLKKMRTLAPILWYPQCLALQKKLTVDRLHIYNHFTPNRHFGVEVVDLLDMMLGTGYRVSCTYDLQKNSCSLRATYFTNDLNFVTYLPGLHSLKDCDNKRLSDVEKNKVLRYLIFLVMLHNGLHLKKEEYLREFSYMNGLSLDGCSAFSRRCTFRRVDGSNIVSENYCRKLLGPQGPKLLQCDVSLTCSLECAPHQIFRSFERLKNDLQLQDEGVICGDRCDDVKLYRSRIKVVADWRNKRKERFEITFLDGD